MDSAPGITASAAHAFAALSLPTPDADALRAFVGPPITDSFPAHGVPPDRIAEAVAAYRAEYREHGMWNNSVFPGIPHQLQRLRQAGCTLLVATSKPQVFADPIMERFDLRGMVDGVFGAPLDEHRSTKADVIAAALASLGRAASGQAASGGPVLMVGDREHDVIGAREHAIDTLGVTWGYAAPGELPHAGAVAVIDDVANLASTTLALLAR
jgi:phosphoglycolate phosphatase